MNMNSGYKGFAMSNNAVSAYDRGEKPLSKWTKADIIAEARQINADKARLLSALPLSVLKAKCLYCSSWHHTSEYCNQTDFYSINDDFVDDVTAEDIEKLKGYRPPKKTEKSYIGAIHYLVWSGTRNHPRAEERTLSDVLIVKRGCFYHVFSKDGTEILKKKIDSKGTHIEAEEV